MAYPCPGCGADVEASLEAWVVRCRSCGARIRSRSVESGGPARLYEVEVVGRPETRRRVEAPWTEAEGRRLAAWLLWSSVLTLGLVVVLYLVARSLR